MTEELVFKGENSQALTNSLLVAEKFGKRHGDVIRSIEKLLNTEDETLNAKMRLAFESASYVDSTGKSNLMYVMNRKGFSILKMLSMMLSTKWKQPLKIVKRSYRVQSIFYGKHSLW